MKKVIDILPCPICGEEAGHYQYGLAGTEDVIGVICENTWCDFSGARFEDGTSATIHWNEQCVALVTLTLQHKISELEEIIRRIDKEK